MSEENNIANQSIKEINTQIIKGIYKVFNIAIFFTIIIIGFRFYNYGYNLFGLYQIIILIFALFVGFFREKLMNIAKVWIIIFCTYLVLISGFWNLGSLASAKLYFILYPTLLSMIYGFKKSFILTSFLSLPIIIIALLHYNSIIGLNNDMQVIDYYNSTSKWLLDIFGMLIMGIMIISVIINYKEALSENKE